MNELFIRELRIDWTQIEERQDQTFAISATYSTYDDVAYVKNSPNAKEFFHFSFCCMQRGQDGEDGLPAF